MLSRCNWQRLERSLDRTRRRWSFSAISARGRDAFADPQDESLGDTGAADEAQADTDSPDGAAGLPLGALAGGTRFGTLVHAVLEGVDFAAEDLDAELTAAVSYRFEGTAWPPEAVVDGLRTAIEAPLGLPFGKRRLRDLTRADRLDELNFELRLAGRGRSATDANIGVLLGRHLSASNPLGPWALGLRSGVFGVDLAGHLTGSIDMVARVRDPGAPDRFVVVDYKTNLLGEPGRPATAADYRPERLAGVMAEHHYPLQALLYSVALHRYLRWRLKDYRPEVNLAGIAYLFVRGMVPPSTTDGGAPTGVFSWQVPPSLVVELSDLLDGAEE